MHQCLKPEKLTWSGKVESEERCRGKGQMCCSVFDSGGMSVKIWEKERIPLTKIKKKKNQLYWPHTGFQIVFKDLLLRSKKKFIPSGVSLYFSLVTTTASGKFQIIVYYRASLHLVSNDGITFVKGGKIDRKMLNLRRKNSIIDIRDLVQVGRA